MKHQRGDNAEQGKDNAHEPGTKAESERKSAEHLDGNGAGQGQVRQRQANAVDVAQCIGRVRSEEHTSELQSLMRISYAVFCLKKKKKDTRVLQKFEQHI